MIIFNVDDQIILSQFKTMCAWEQSREPLRLGMRGKNWRTNRKLNNIDSIETDPHVLTEL